MIKQPSPIQSGRAFTVIVLGSVLLMIAAIAICMWHQPLFLFDRPIDTSKLADCFSAIGAIATAGTLAGLIVQVIEARRSRSLDFQPYLHPQAMTFSVVVNRVDDSIPGDYVVGLRDDKGKALARLTIKNIGNHFAKNLEVLWEYDSNAVAEFVKPSYGHFINWLNDYNDPEMIGALAAGETVEVSLPEYYCSCCAKKLNKSSWLPNAPERPALKLRLKYQNIIGEQFDFPIPVEIFAYQDFVGFNFPNAAAHVNYDLRR